MYVYPYGLLFMFTFYYSCLISPLLQLPYWFIPYLIVTLLPYLIPLYTIAVAYSY